jgi:hypothetical protein
MILFAEDFALQGASIHTATKNMSFIKQHAILKKMGIQNNMFFMSIIQKDIAKYDPHDLKDNSEELAGRIALECKLNPWYYLREVIRIPAAGKNITYELSRGNLALTWLFLNNIDVYLVMARQCGKTMSTQAIISWVMYFMATQFNIAMLTKDNDLVQENVKRLKDIRNGLPQYLLLRNKLKDTERKEGLSYDALNNQYQTFTAQGDTFSAEKLGRGMSTPCQHWDETEYFRYINLSYPSAVSATTTAAGQAKELGLPHSNILTSTAGKLNSPETQFALSLIEKSMVFTEQIYDCKNREELHSLVERHSTNKMVYAVFSYLQLDKSHQWFKETSARTGGTPEEIARDYLNMRQAGVIGSIIPVQTLERIKSSQMEPVKTEINGGYAFRWYQDPAVVINSKIYRRPLIMGLDTSENIGRDFTTLCMVDPSDLSVVCTARCNESDLVRFATFLGEYMVKHDNLFLVPERKSTGSIILSIICGILRRAGINPWTRIYNEVFQNRGVAPYNTVDVSSSDAELGADKKYLGYVTAGKGENSRNTLYKTTLMKTVELNATRIHDLTLIAELSQLRLKNDRIDHSNGGHDDMVIAYLLACWFVHFGRNLQYYKLDKNDFLSGVNSSGEKVNPDDRKAQTELRNRISEIKKEIRNTTYPAVRSSYIRELTYLESLVEGDEDDSEVQVIRAEDAAGKVSRVDPSLMRQTLRMLRF